MTTVRGILGQSTPAAAVLTDLYTVPTGKSCTVRVIVSNRAATPTSFRVSVAIAGAADANAQYIVYDKAIAGNETGSTIAFMMNAGDIARVQAALATLSFTITGLEQDNET